MSIIKISKTAILSNGKFIGVRLEDIACLVRTITTDKIAYNTALKGFATGR